MPTSFAPWMLPLTALSLLLPACQSPGRPAARGAAAAEGAPAPARRAPIGLDKVLAATEAEFAASEQLLMQHGDAARELGRINASFQSVGYFRRVTTDPAVHGLESNLRALAERSGLRLHKLGTQIDPPPVVKTRALKPGEVWQPELEELRGVVHLTIDLIGSPPQVAAFINRIVAEVERLVIISGSEDIPGGVRLFGEAYFEHHIVAPKIELIWPTLRQRLVAAGHDPADPKLAQDPSYPRLKELVDAGRGRLPEVIGALKVVSDFPRWHLRRAFFEDRSMVASGMRGEQILGTTLPAAP